MESRRSASAGRAARPLLRRALLAAGAAAVINGLLFLIGQAVGAFPETALVPRRDAPMSIGPILALSILGPLAGAGAYALLRRFTTRATAAFVVLAVLILILMAVPPFQIQAAPPTMLALLQVMHLVAAAATFWAVLRSRS
jgi:hypothetical protein